MPSMKSNRFIFTVALCGFLTILLVLITRRLRVQPEMLSVSIRERKISSLLFRSTCSLSISHSVGQGTFLLNPNTNATSDHGLENNGVLDYASNPNVSSFASATIIAKVPALKATLLYNQSFQAEWTQNDLATNAFQPVYFDPATRLLWGGVWKGVYDSIRSRYDNSSFYVVTVFRLPKSCEYAARRFEKFWCMANQRIDPARYQSLYSGCCGSRSASRNLLTIGV